MALKGISSRKSGKINILKSLYRALSSRGAITVTLVMAALLGLLTLGQVSFEGPTVPVQNESGFYSFYDNGTYHIVIFSFTENGTPETSQGVRMDLTNYTTQASTTLHGTIGQDGMAEINFTSNKTWNALLYLHEPFGYQGGAGYGISPVYHMNSFLSYFPIYDHGFRNKAGFLIFYVSPNGASSPNAEFRMSYNGFDGTSSTAYRGDIGLGNASSFRYTGLYPDYGLIPSNLSSVYGNPQYNTGSGWKNVSNYNSVVQYQVYVKPSQRYLEPQVYHAFFDTDTIFVSLFSIITALLVFGYPKANHTVELLLSKPLSRSDVILSKYLSSIALTGIAVLSTLLVMELLFHYYFSLYLNAHAFLLVFVITLMLGAIFSSFTFLLSALGKHFILILTGPLAVLFFFYYVFGPFINGLAVLLGTFNVGLSNTLQNYGGYLSPFQVVTGLMVRLDRELGYMTGGFTPFSKQYVILILFLWCAIPFLTAFFIWRRSDV